MWKFLKNLFKKRKSLTKVAFNYDDNTKIIGEKDKKGLWTVEIETSSDLDKNDFSRILSKLKQIIKKGDN